MFFLTIWRPIRKSGLLVQFNVLFDYMEANSKIRFSGLMVTFNVLFDYMEANSKIRFIGTI